MKVAILAGGVGSRLSEETESKPKPMVEIGGKPILWHIMKNYAQPGLRRLRHRPRLQGRTDQALHGRLPVDQSDLTISLGTGSIRHHDGARDDWTVELIDTGTDTKTGGRIKRLAPYLGNETFMLTWGDGVSDIDLDELLRVPPQPRQARHGDGGAAAGALRPHGARRSTRSSEFSEKPQTGEGWINGAFFVLEPGCFDYIDGDDDASGSASRSSASRKDGQLMAYRHDGVLAVHGHAARQEAASRTLWDGGRGAMEDVGLT